MITTRFCLAHFLADLGYARFDSHITLSSHDVVDGMVRNERGRNIIHVVDDLNTHTRAILKMMEQSGHAAEDDAGHFEEWSRLGPVFILPTDFRRIACYAVRGSNEGHYIHAELVLRDDKRITLGIAKTFGGMDHALLLCSIATCLLNGAR